MAVGFAQHMDSLLIGRGTVAILPEAVKAAGASGVQVNHFERRLNADELARAMRRADEVGLATMVCADKLEHAVQIAALGPDVLIVEASDQIASADGGPEDPATIGRVNAAIWPINPGIRILHAAGTG